MRAENISSKFDFIVSRAVAKLDFALGYPKI